MFDSNKASAYHKKIKLLAGAENAHRSNLDALDKALAERQANQVPRLRKAAMETESALQAILQAASSAHRQYWQHRREQMIQEVEHIASILRRFDLISKAAGDASIHPARTVLESCSVVCAEIINEDGVPTEGPDSAILEDYLGSWK
jgi:hypothetical protein